MPGERGVRDLPGSEFSDPQALVSRGRAPDEPGQASRAPLRPRPSSLYLRSEHQTSAGGGSSCGREYPLESPQARPSGLIGRHILVFFAGSMSWCRKCPTCDRTEFQCFYWFHTHAGFARNFLNSFGVDPPAEATLGWIKPGGVSPRERRPYFGRLGIGSAFSFRVAGLPSYYTHITRLCKVNSEARMGRQPTATVQKSRALRLRCLRCGLAMKA
jgi:hypothetical protein